MKKPSKIALGVVVGAGVLSLAISPFSATPGKWIEAAGLLFDIGGIIQLEISGLFEHILEKYGDDEKYPGGPPSYITREIIDNPDTPIRSWLYSQLYWNRGTGFWLLVSGFIFQMVANWV